MGAPRKFTDQQIIDALAANGDSPRGAATALGCSTGTITYRLKTSARVKEYYKKTREGHEGRRKVRTDLVIQTLHENGYSITRTAKALKKSRYLVHNYINNVDEVRQAYKTRYDYIVDLAWGKAIDRIAQAGPDGKTDRLLLEILKMYGKVVQVSRTEITGKDGVDLFAGLSPENQQALQKNGIDAGFLYNEFIRELANNQENYHDQRDRRNINGQGSKAGGGTGTA